MKKLKEWYYWYIKGHNVKWSVVLAGLIAFICSFAFPYMN